ncbi:MAG: flagellar hook-basal body complex protein FliE [Gallionellaceae bacterium]|nr:flagellar hook-basal body complex protein FliE [Gallionellaceae bacterium]
MNDIDLMVNQLRAVAAQASVGAPVGAANAATQPPSQDFATLLQSAVDEVNNTQLDARQLTKQFESGNAEVNLQDVVLSLQKASLSFQTMVQVRNKLVSAYQEVMNMQV